MVNNNELRVGLALAFLFFVGSLIGWGLEFFFRNLISHSGPRGRLFINPGFCVGPYLPIYGAGLTVMFVISFILSADRTVGKISIILLIAVIMTVIEFAGGMFLLKVLKMRLWDYRDMPGNFQGVVCPQFSLIWGAIGAAYFIFIHPLAEEWLLWLSNNLPFAFFIGLFYGVFIIDYSYSMLKANIIRKYGERNEIIVKYEELKALMTEEIKHETQKNGFFKQTAGGIKLEKALEKHGITVGDKFIGKK